MLLAIDVGNTNVVFALYEGDCQKGVWRCATDCKRTSDEYAVWLTHLMVLRGCDSSRISAAILASVVPGATFALKKLCRDYFACEPKVVGDPSVALGVTALVDRPEEVGADRLVNAVGAFGSYEPPMIVIDFGTATTFDVVDVQGNYCGGVIAPGINLSLEALHMAAAKLPRVDIVQPATVIGKGTVSCIQSGVFWGYVGLIEGLVARIQNEFGQSMTVIATGGLAGLFAKATFVINHIDGDLTLRGLLLIHQRNSAS
ncbi:Type III pantothenate kinase [Azospirillaceae bacterium]